MFEEMYKLKLHTLKFVGSLLVMSVDRFIFIYIRHLMYASNIFDS